MSTEISGYRAASMSTEVGGVLTDYTGHIATMRVSGSPPSGSVSCHGDGSCAVTLHLPVSGAVFEANLDEIAGRLSERTPVTSDQMRAIGIDDALEAMARGRS